MKQKFGVVMQRTVLELQGVECIPLVPKPPAKKQIVSSRSFGSKVSALSDLKEAMSLYAQNAVKRLRSQELLCGELSIFVQSNPFNKNEKFYSKAVNYKFSEATDDVLEIVRITSIMVEAVYLPGINFKKCGVVLVDLKSKNNHIFDLLTEMQEIEKKERFMTTFENIQDKYGKRKISVGSCNMPNRNWSMKQDRLSKNPFTWDGLIKVN